MTTTASKLPAHGTQYRYRGPRNGSWTGCRCVKCTRAHNRAQKQRALARLSGKPPLHPAEPIVAHIKVLTESGMSHALIARRAKVAAATISYLIRGLTKSCQRDKALRILAVQPNDFDDLADRPALGSRRRVQALYVIGHNPATIAAVAGLDESTVSHLANERHEATDGRTAIAIRQAYQILSVTPGTSARGRNRAVRNGWAPPAAWDDDRIDDPTAHPEWTGDCGTDRGWWIHSINDIPVCARCDEAHAQWKTERSHLSHKERWSEIGKARAAASNRGATIAADARELFGYGVGIDQAAERLGVTRQHLQQELVRHPDTERTAA